MNIGDISIKKQLMIICVVLVTVPVIILGWLSYQSARQALINNIHQTLGTQCADWLITTQAYYDLVKENKLAAKDKTKDIVTSQALGILDLIQNHLQEDQTQIAALKEPLLRAQENEKNMRLYSFAIDEFGSYVKEFDEAISDIQTFIADAAKMGLFSKAAEAALEQYKQKAQAVKQAQGIESLGGIADGAIRLAYEKLEAEFEKLAVQVAQGKSDDRLKASLSSTVIGQTGYIYILDYRGNYLLSKGRKRDGENAWYAQDNQGRFFVQEITEKAKALKEGKIEYVNYAWQDAEEEKATDKLVALMHLPQKQWIVGAAFYPQDLIEADFEEMKKEELKTLMAQQKIRKSGYLFIIGTQGENKGRYIVSKDRKSDRENILELKDAQDRFFVREIIEDAVGMKKSESRIKNYFWQDGHAQSPRTNLLAYVYFEPWDWVIAASAYLDEFVADIKNIRNQIALVCLAAIILGSSVAFLFASKMTDTFRQLVNKMNAVAKGNLEVETRDVRALETKNEIGQLTKAFKRMTNDLRQTTFSKDYVDNIIGNMNDALLVIDRDGIIQTINRASSQLLGYDQSQITKRPLSDFFTLAKEKWEGIQKRVFDGETVENLEIEFKDKFGHSIPASFNAAPFRDAEGKVSSAILVARDIREHKALVEELSRARRTLEEKVKKLEKSDQAMLFMVEDLNATSQDLKQAKDKLQEKIIEVERSNKELDDFTYVVSHDLKEPLRGIGAFSAFLTDKYKDRLDKQGQHYVEVIQSSTQKMQTLISDLLELSRISRIKKPPEDVDLNKLLDEIKGDLALRIEETKTKLKVLRLPTVKYEKTRITQLFTNLITNAIKYNDKESPLVEVGCDQTTGAKFRCYVKDNGKGIPKEFQEKVFGLFQRLDANQNKGTGAGLTICKKIVESHGGRIWVESTTGRGSTFYFTIPKQPEVNKK